MNKPAHPIRQALLGIALLGHFIPTLVFADSVPGGSAVRLQSLLEPDNIASKPRPLSIKGWKTTSGSKVLFIRTTASPMFDIHVSFDAGSARSNIPGLAGVTFSMINEGAPGKENHQAIIETFQALGAQLGMHIDNQRSAFSLRSLSEVEKSSPALQLFSQMLGKPLLSDEALARVKTESKDILLREKQTPQKIVAQRLKEQLAPQTPYAQPVFATNETLTRQAVQDFHRRAYSARSAQITMVGDLTLEQAQLISRQISDALPHSTLAGPDAPPLTGTPRASHIERAYQQTQLLLAQLNVPNKHVDHPALEAGTRILEARLMTELREKRGLVYGAEIQHSGWIDNGLTVISLRTSPKFSQGIQVLIRSMFTDYLRDGPTQQELDQLKRQMQSSNAHTSTNNAQILHRLVDINRYDRPLDLDYSAQQMQRLSLKQIKDALSRHLADDRWHVVTAGPTVEQQPLPLPVSPSAGAISQHSCPAAQTVEAS